MNDNVTGVLYMLLATFMFSLMATFVKLLSDIPTLEVVFFRALVSVVLCVWGLRQVGLPLFGSNYRLLGLRGIFGALALTSNFYLVQQIPLASASTLLYLAPVFTTLLGIFIVKERVSWVQGIFFLLSFIGVLVVQGFDARISFLHLSMGLFSSVCMGLAYNMVRKLSNLEHPLVIIFYFPLMCLPIAGLATLLNWVQPTPLQWLYLLLVGITTQIAQYYLTLSYQKARISTVSIVNYTSIIYSLSIGYILFDEYFNAMTYLGMFLVLSGVVLNVAWQERKRIRKTVSGQVVNKV